MLEARGAGDHTQTFWHMCTYPTDPLYDVCVILSDLSDVAKDGDILVYTSVCVLCNMQPKKLVKVDPKFCKGGLLFEHVTGHTPP